MTILKLPRLIFSVSEALLTSSGGLQEGPGRFRGARRAADTNFNAKTKKNRSQVGAILDIKSDKNCLFSGTKMFSMLEAILGRCSCFFRTPESLKNEAPVREGCNFSENQGCRHRLRKFDARRPFWVPIWDHVGSRRPKKGVPEAMFKNYTKNLGPGGPREFWNHGPGEVNDYFWGPNPRALTTFRALRL